MGKRIFHLFVCTCTSILVRTDLGFKPSQWRRLVKMGPHFLRRLYSSHSAWPTPYAPSLKSCLQIEARAAHSFLTLCLSKRAHVFYFWRMPSASVWAVAMVTKRLWFRVTGDIMVQVVGASPSILQETDHAASSFSHTINPSVSHTHDVKPRRRVIKAGDCNGYSQMSSNRIKTEPSLIPQQFSRRFRYCREHKHSHLTLAQHR